MLAGATTQSAPHRTHRHEAKEQRMSRTRRLALAAAVVIGGTLTLGGVAYADSSSESTGPSGDSSVLDGHVTPGVNSNQADFAKLTHIKL
jgi:hypothetical protein